MKRLIVVEIDCEDERCGECDLIETWNDDEAGESGQQCKQFGGDAFRRSPECLAAERVIARLQAEVDRLKAENAQLRDKCNGCDDAAFNTDQIMLDVGRGQGRLAALREVREMVNEFKEHGMDVPHSLAYAEDYVCREILIRIDALIAKEEKPCAQNAKD